MPSTKCIDFDELVRVKKIVKVRNTISKCRGKSKHIYLNCIYMGNINLLKWNLMKDKISSFEKYQTPDIFLESIWVLWEWRTIKENLWKITCETIKNIIDRADCE